MYSPSSLASGPLVRIAGGRSYHLQHADGTWYVFIDGKYYCAADPETLLRGLELKFHLLKPHIPAPDIHPIRIAEDLLRSNSSSLQERQNDRQELKSYAARGDVVASLLLEALGRKVPSAEAKKITERLKKFDFADVTHEELVQHVNNLVLRSKLILELSDRLRF